MSSERLAFLSILLLGIAAVLSFHSSGAVSERDALTLAAFDGGISTSPPGPVTRHVTELGTRLVRLLWSAAGLFRAAHLAVGLLLALAAALSARVAHRAASFPTGSDDAAWAAAVLVGAGVLFGADTGRLGLEAGPVAILLALLSGAAAAWTAATPRPALGGFLLGLALADHPLVLFLLPGFGAMALGGTLRIAPGEGARFVRQAWLGFAAGFAAVLVPLLDARTSGLLLVSHPRSIGGAFAAWWGSSPSAWTFAGPSAWAGGIAHWVVSMWRAAGLIGLALGLAGIVAFFRGGARLLRPFLLGHGLLALAIVLGSPADRGVAGALVGWSFLFWGVPTLAGLRSRRVVVAFISAAALLALNVRTLDRSAEKGVAWAATVLDTAPPNTLLLTLNPVQLALAADGLRPDVDVIDLAYPSTLESFRTGRALLPDDQAVPALKVGPTTIHALFAYNIPLRPVLVDPSVYFLDASLGGTRDVRYRLSPHGVAYRARFADEETPNAEAGDATLAWQHVNVTPGTPPSPLRGGLTGGKFFARALLISGSLYLEEGRELDAERDFLLALGHPDADRTAAAQGLARIFFERHDYAEVIDTLRGFVRDKDPSAWLAYKILASAYAYSHQPGKARQALLHGMALVPPGRPDQRTEMQQLLDALPPGNAGLP